MQRKFKLQAAILTLLYFGLVLWVRAANELAEIFPTNVQRVVFLGDSITYGGDYVTDIVAWQRTRHPEQLIEIINVGLPSETISGLSEPGHAGGKFPRPDLHERLARVLTQTKPDLVFTCYGMNDGIYLPFDQARFQAFTNGITWLHNAVVESGAKIVHLTPPVFDELKGGHPGYAETLDRYSDWLIKQRAIGWQVIDIHTPMKDALVKARESNPAFVFAKDGIHPDAAGHWVMAKSTLVDLGATDVNAYTNAINMMASVPNGSEIFAFVRQQQIVMKDVWLTATGHKRPMKPGLPLADAQAQAAQMEKQIQALLPKK